MNQYYTTTSAQTKVCSPTSGTQGQVSVPLLQHIVCPLVVRKSIEKFENMENSSYLCSEDK